MDSLSPTEMYMASTLAVIRKVHSIQSGLRHASKFSPEAPWDNELLGTVTELAVSKFTGLHWHMNVGRFHEPDVGHYHVRGIRNPEDRLIIRPDDTDGEYVLAYWDGMLGVQVLGCMDAVSSKEDRYWFDKNGKAGCWMVPQGVLLPVPTVRDHLFEVRV